MKNHAEEHCLDVYIYTYLCVYVCIYICIYIYIYIHVKCRNRMRWSTGTIDPHTSKTTSLQHKCVLTSSSDPLSEILTPSGQHCRCSVWEEPWQWRHYAVPHGRPAHPASAWPCLRRPEANHDGSIASLQSLGLNQEKHVFKTARIEDFSQKGSG